MHLASNMFIVNLTNDVIKKNGKTYLAVKNVNVKFNTNHIQMHLHSQHLNSVVIGLINKTINTQWRNFYEKIQSDDSRRFCMQSVPVCSLVGT